MPVLKNKHPDSSRASELATMIQDLAKRQANWTDADRKDWEIVNAEYDREIKVVKDAEENRKALQADLDKLPPYSSGQDVDDILDRHGFRRPAELPGAPATHSALPGGMMFRDGSGNEHRALRPTDKLCSKPVNVGESIVNLVLGRPQNVNVGGGDTSGGYLLNPELSGTLIDLARSASVSLRAGAQTLPMATSELSLAKLVGDPTAHWRPEATAVTSSDITLSKVVLKAKTLAAVVPVSIELLEDANNAGSVIENALRSALGLALDQAVLNGSGTTDPLGILQDSDVNTVAGIGTPSDTSHLTSAVSKILTANYGGDPSTLSFISHPRDLLVINDLVDTTGQPKIASPWASALQQFSTTSLPSTDGRWEREQCHRRRLPASAGRHATHWRYGPRIIVRNNNGQ